MTSRFGMGTMLKGKNKEALLLQCLPMCQNLHPLLYGPLFGCFSHQTFCSCPPPRNLNSHDNSHNTIYCSMVLKWTVSTPTPFKVNAVPPNWRGSLLLLELQEHHQFLSTSQKVWCETVLYHCTPWNIWRQVRHALHGSQLTREAPFWG